MPEIGTLGLMSGDGKRGAGLQALSYRAHANCRGSTTLVRCFYGADFVKGVPQGSYPFSRPSVSLFDLERARFLVPTHTIAWSRRAQERSRMGVLAPSARSLTAPSTTADLPWSG